jgi:uncharacterized protein involved in exopolysaccharide biosynthesis
MPGHWLLVFGRWIFSEAVMSIVIEPTIGDMRLEWSEAAGSSVAKLRARIRGYIAFWTIVAMSPISFTGWHQDQAESPIQRSSSMSVTSGTRLVLVLVVLGLGAGYLYGRAQPVLYRSSAVIQVVPPRVPDTILKAPTTTPLADRLRATEATILSRTRLENLVKEFNLYPDEQSTELMETVLARMRRDISTAALKGDVFQVQYVGGDPVIVMKVTERLASLFLEESLRDGQRRTEGTRSFLESRIEETSKRLVAVNAELEGAAHSPSAMPKRLELEVIQNIYKDLIARREEMLTTYNLQRRQIGEQFVLLDGAQVPRVPISPPRVVFTLGGGAVGLVVALLIVLGSYLRRFIGRGRDRDVAGATA